MQLLFDSLKGQFNSLNIILVFLLLGSFFQRWGKKKPARVAFIFSVLTFLSCSTAYLPHYLAQKIEGKYAPFQLTEELENSAVYIHVLGGGYTADPLLPELSQLSSESLGRLMEGIRLQAVIPNSILVCSGYAASGSVSLAEVSKIAAQSLGADAARIALLNTPTTTQEEVEALKMKYGTAIKVVVVTSALHMDRAIRLYQSAGLNTWPAPTNFLVKVDSNPYQLKFIPAIENMRIMDALIREYMGRIKIYFVS